MGATGAVSVSVSARFRFSVSVRFRVRVTVSVRFRVRVSVSVRFRVKVRVTAGILNTVMVGCVSVSVRVRVRVFFSALQAFSTQPWLVMVSHGWLWLVMVGNLC